MRSVRKTSDDTLIITEENGAQSEWVPSAMVRGSDEEFDFSSEFKYEGRWYVRPMEAVEKEEEE